MGSKLLSSIFLFGIFIFFVGYASGQNQNNRWHFGNNAGLNFSSGNPVSFITSAMVSIEGCASVSDPSTGNLLFYSNGQVCWDASNNPMPNGNGLLGGPNTSASQGVLIVPYPNNPSQYFLFTVDETGNNSLNGFRYSLVDMTLNNGLGDILPAQKNILIQNNTSERLAVAKKADGKGFWIIIHERANSLFQVYEITETGLNPTPVTSNVGLVHSIIPQANGDETMGCMKFNHQYNKIAVALYGGNTIQVLDFDNCSGIVSNPISLSTLDNPYGIEFSPDDSRLYFSLYYNAGFQGAVYQANMLAPSIPASVSLIGISSSFNNQCVGSLETGPDGKIYVAINSESWLSAITQPNNLGAACGFVDQAITLLPIGLFPTTSLFGLPQQVPILDSLAFENNSILAENFCYLDSTLFQILGNQNFTSIRWDFGDPGSGANNTAQTNNPSHQFSSAGTYTINATLYTLCDTTSVNLSIEIINCPNTCDGQITFTDTCLENGTLFQIQTTDTLLSVTWNFGDPTSGNNNNASGFSANHLFSNPGVYTVLANVSATCGNYQTTVQIEVVNCNNNCTGLLVADTACVDFESSFQIQSLSPISAIQWNFGDTASGLNNTSNALIPTHSFSDSGTFLITAIVSFACGTDTLYEQINIEPCDSTAFAESCEIYIPNAFTPNKKGLNELFKTASICQFEQFEFRIFNRWGELLFKTENPMEGWDGTYKKVECPLGIYAYSLNYKLPLEANTSVFGKICLVR